MKTIHLSLSLSLFLSRTQAKFWYDLPPSPIINNWFHPRDICTMELACLSALGFDLNVHPHEYEKFVLKMEDMAEREFGADIQVCACFCPPSHTRAQ